MKTRPMSVPSKYLLTLLLLVVAVYGSVAFYNYASLQYALKTADWDALKLMAKIGAAVAYVLMALVLGKSPCYYVSVLFANIEANQRLLVAVVSQAWQQYGVQRKQYQNRVRREIGEQGESVLARSQAQALMYRGD